MRKHCQFTPAPLHYTTLHYTTLHPPALHYALYPSLITYTTVKLQDVTNADSYLRSNTINKSLGKYFSALELFTLWSSFWYFISYVVLGWQQLKISPVLIYKGIVNNATMFPLWNIFWNNRVQNCLPQTSHVPDSRNWPPPHKITSLCSWAPTPRSGPAMIRLLPAKPHTEVAGDSTFAAG